MGSPQLSLVIAAYDMPRQLERTIRSLSPPLQRGVRTSDYELIVVDNGSSRPPDRAACEAFGATVRWIRVDDAPASPARALNRGIAAARGELIGAMIDGARLVSPGVLAAASAAAAAHAQPVVATIGFHLGGEPQQLAVASGYDEAAEEELLAASGWSEDGYRLFDVAVPAPSAGRGWRDVPGETNAIFMPRQMWAELGGFDEAFRAPGGGLVNHDLFARACALPRAQLVLLLGEGTFHQVHGGVSTNAPPGGFAALDAEYARLRGRPFERPDVEPAFWGEPRPGMFGSGREAADVVCVLGMSRSGTSLTTRILSLCGVYVGAEEELLGPMSVNPAGFWEHHGIMRLNEEILRTLGGSWRDPPPLEPGWERSEELDDARRRAAELIESSFAGRPLWGWKDPRNCLTLPFWQQLLPRMRYVICLRNPVDVAASLERRERLLAEDGRPADGMDAGQAFELYGGYLAAALANTAGRERIFVSYEEYFEDWRDPAGRLARFARADLDALGGDAEAEIEATIDRGLRHHRSAAAQALEDPRLPAAVGGLYVALEHLRRLQGSSGLQPGRFAELADAADRCARRLLAEGSAPAQARATAASASR